MCTPKMSRQSRHCVDSEGFQLVKSKRNSKRKHSKFPSKECPFIKQDRDREVDIPQFFCQFDRSVEELRRSIYFKNIYSSLKNILKDKKVIELVCFGLGEISNSRTSRYQLAFLLCLKALLNPKRVLVHDPIFCKVECELLGQLDVEVIDYNHEGSYPISEEGVTIMFLPHCPKQLTNNFLWSNWGVGLQNCVFIGNSFKLIYESGLVRKMLHTLSYIYKIYPYVAEERLINNFVYQEIFNDTSIHTFPIKLLEKLPPEFWIKGDKPSYRNAEEFITSLMLEKLNI